MNSLKIKKPVSESKDELRQKAKRWNERKTSYRQNEDGTRSTHKMATATTDDGAIAYPTLFPKDPKKTNSTDPKDWIELEGKAAIDMATSRGEVYKFSSEENAKKWAEGEYKKN
jgi:hypothetical protein